MRFLTSLVGSLATPIRRCSVCLANARHSVRKKGRCHRIGGSRRAPAETRRTLFSGAFYVNIKLAAELCAKDWGLWRTTTMNLDKVKQLAHHYTQLTDKQKSKVEEQVDVILKRMNDEPKPLPWRIRDRVGDRVKWYKDVDEV